jgi:hypothetical protein
MKLTFHSFFETISSQSNQTKETRDSNMMYYYYWQNYQIPHVLKQGAGADADIKNTSEDAVPRYRIPVTTNTT